MKAAIYDRYGDADVLELREIERPAIADGDVLVQVHATAVSTGDWRMRASAFPGLLWLPGRLMAGLFKPKHKILGSAFSGQITRTGSAVNEFQAGEEVFGFAPSGAHAEFVGLASAGAIARKPAAIGHAEAAAIPFGALSALVFLRDYARLQRGQKILICGASGGVGVFAVQLARHFGAEVTGVCSTGNVELVRSLGAHHVIDYTVQDFTTNGEIYDVVFDTAGTTNFARCRNSLAPQGIFIPLEFKMTEVLQSLVTAWIGGPRVLIGISGDKHDDLAYLADLVERGAIAPVIDPHFYTLDRIADAHRRVESRHKTGTVVVAVDDLETMRLATAP